MSSSLSGRTRLTLAQWAWERRRFGLRVTALSFAFTGGTMLALAAVHESLSQGSAGGSLLALPLSAPALQAPGASLAMFALAILAWVVLMSISSLVVARQVRDYLKDMSSAQGTGVNLLNERMMVEAYLGALSTGARAVALTLALGYLLPHLVLIGLAVSLGVAAVLARQRLRAGMELQSWYSGVARQWRRAPDPTNAADFTEAIYRRDTHMSRLPLRQLLLLVAVIVVLVVVPAWLAGSSFGAASLLILLVWVQAVIGVTTNAGSIGWRWSALETDPRPGERGSRDTAVLDD